MKTINEILDDNGFYVACENPLEIESMDGDTATGVAAQLVIEYLKECDES